MSGEISVDDKWKSKALPIEELSNGCNNLYLCVSMAFLAAVEFFGNEMKIKLVANIFY